MAKCKYCHESITRLDKDVCPFCGGLKPLEGTDTSTQDVTKVVNQFNGNFELKQKRKLVASLLAIFLGFFGIQHLYLKKIKLCLIMTLISLILIGGIGSILFFLVFSKSVIGYIIPVALIEVVNIISAIRFYTRNDIVDANGDFLV